MRRFLALGLGLLGMTSAQAALQLKGWIEWQQKVELRVLENGVVDEVAVTAGQRVRKGELLLRMDQREARAHLLEARARVARAKVAREKAARELARTQELFDRGLNAAEELKEAELQEAAVSAEEAAAAAAEVVAQVALERTELRAPFEGIVVARNTWQGEVIYKTLQPAPLLVVAPDDRLLARALVTADVLRLYRPGQSVRINVSGQLREGRIYSLGVEPVRVELQGAVYPLDVIFERPPNDSLRPSESVLIMLP